MDTRFCLTLQLRRNPAQISLPAACCACRDRLETEQEQMQTCQVSVAGGLHPGVAVPGTLTLLQSVPVCWMYVRRTENKL